MKEKKEKAKRDSLVLAQSHSRSPTHSDVMAAAAFEANENGNEKNEEIAHFVHDDVDTASASDSDTDLDSDGSLNALSSLNGISDRSGDENEEDAHEDDDSDADDADGQTRWI